MLIAAALLPADAPDKPREIFINWLYNSLSLSTACEVISLVHKQTRENKPEAYARAEQLIREAGYPLPDYTSSSV